MTRLSPTKRHPARLSDAALDDLLDDQLDGRLDTVADALAEIDRAEVDGVASGVVAGRARLLASLESTHRFDDLEASVAELLDVDQQVARQMLLDVDRASVWEEGPSASCALFHVDGGEKVRDAVTGFVRVVAGSGFPQHEHLGDETVLVLQGAFRDRDGAIVSAGEIARMPAGSAHSFEVEGDLPLLYLAIVQKGVVFDGTPVYPGDPRG